MKTTLSSPLRTCLREPTPAIEAAADLLAKAVAQYLAGNRTEAASLLREADSESVREWAESLWGKGSKYAPSGPKLPTPAVAENMLPRMPSFARQAELHLRDGYYCRFCGIPVVRMQIREALRRQFPEVQIWGTGNKSQHAALQCMWAQYDHLVPHSRGGTNDLENLVVTCAPCNYARMQYTLEEAGLLNPLHRPARVGPWTGLEHLLSAAKPT